MTKKFSWEEYEFDDITKNAFHHLLQKNSKTLENYFDDSHRDIEEKIVEVEKVVRHAKANLPHDNHWFTILYFWNIVGFVLLVDLELKTQLYILIHQEGYMRQEVQIANCAVCLYESMMKLKSYLFGGDFWTILDDLGVSGHLRDDIKRAKGRHDDFVKLHEKSLKKVRSVIGAHKDGNFAEQLSMLRALDRDSFVQLLIVYGNILHSLSEFFRHIISLATDWIGNQHNNNS